MCKKRRVASSYIRCGPDMACLGGSVICNLRRQRQWHPGIASAVRCISRKQKQQRHATNHDDCGYFATVDTMVRCAQSNNGIGRQRDQKRQGAVVRSGTKPQTRYGYECSGAESHVPVACTCLYLTTAWLVVVSLLLISDWGSCEQSLEDDDGNNSSNGITDPPSLNQSHDNHWLVSEVSCV
jgi:hypothetical protein